MNLESIKVKFDDLVEIVDLLRNVIAYGDDEILVWIEKVGMADAYQPLRITVAARNGPEILVTYFNDPTWRVEEVVDLSDSELPMDEQLKKLGPPQFRIGLTV